MRDEILKKMLAEASQDKPVTRETIMHTYRVSDRSARKMIEDLREQGVRVCGQNTDKGYWIAKTQEEYERFRRDYVAKATTIFRRARNMDEETDKRQVSMFELL